MSWDLGAYRAELGSLEVLAFLFDDNQCLHRVCGHTPRAVSRTWDELDRR